MIRRDVILADGRRGWLLVSQVEHARLSAQLAAQCPLALPSGGGAERPATGEVHAELLAAIEHHDDGWSEWERAPLLDPFYRRPLSFVELPAAEATAIWSRSIEFARQWGPLAGWVVAGHFLRLAEPADGEDDLAEVAQWRAHTAAAREPWLQTWLAEERDQRSRFVADRAVQWLQLFDVLSLWLCCDSPTGLNTPQQEELHWATVGRLLPVKTEFLAPGASASAHAADPARFPATAVVSIRPWRFRASEFLADVDCYVAPAMRYNEAAELLAARERQRLQWRFVESAG